MSNLYIVSTPIGNLDDITKRALQVLRGVDLILCEDTRTTSKLLARYKISTATLSYHQHSKLKKISQIIKLLESGKDLALVSDAGTPGISDPGGKLIEAVLEQGTGVDIVPIPGASALTAAVSIAGISMGKFVFMGFPPHKRKRQKFFKEVIASKYPVILYESPHRILKTLKELSQSSHFHASKRGSVRMEVIVGRELTKKFETIYRGTISQVIKQLEADAIKGEFVIIVER